MEHKHFKETVKRHTFWMKYIPEGTFDMGDEQGDLWEACRPVQKGIEIQPFYLAEFPVTQALWKAVMGEENNPSNFKGDNRPVEQVSWEDAKDFIKKLNDTGEAKKRHKKDGYLYRLPSEAKWEYAARGGRNEKKNLYAGSPNLKEVGWFRTNSHSETKPVGKKVPNELGLYDMSGNVWEWCEDDWVDTLKGLPKDGSPRKKKDEKSRVVRGGSWGFNVGDCRVAFRLRLNAGRRLDNIGFRLARY